MVNSRILFKVDTLNQINHIIYSPNGEYLLTIHENQAIIWSGDKKIHTIEYFFVSDEDKIEFSLDNKYLLIITETIYHPICTVIYSMDTFEKFEFKHKGKKNEILSASFMETKYIVVQKNCELIEVWDIESNELINSFESKMCTFVKFFSDNKYIITKNNKGFNIWNVLTGKLCKTFATNNWTIQILISPTLKYIIISGQEIIVYQFDGTILHKISKEPMNNFYNFAFTSSDRYFTCGTTSKTLFDIEDPRGIRRYDNINPDEYGLLGTTLYTKTGLTLLQYLNHS